MPTTVSLFLGKAVHAGLEVFNGHLGDFLRACKAGGGPTFSGFATLGGPFLEMPRQASSGASSYRLQHPCCLGL